MRPIVRNSFLPGVLALAGIWAVLMAGCAQTPPPPPEKPRWATLPLADVPPFMRGTIQERVRFTNLDPLSVWAYSLVVNLHGTGDSTAPAWIREYISKQIVIHGFGSTQMRRYQDLSPDDILNDKRVAVVTVEGRLPPGAREGQRVDVIVRALPRSHTTSLAHGVLYQTELGEHGLADPTALGANPLAGVSGGAVFVNPVYALDEGRADSPGMRESQIVGTVMNGAVVKQDRSIDLRLRQPQASAARRIEQLIQHRWHGSSPYDENGLHGRVIADAQNEGLVEIFVPVEYNGDWRHFVGVVSHMYLDDSPAFIAAKTRQLIVEAHKPNAQLADISLCWEAMGQDALPIFEPLISDPDPGVAFAAARAAAFLGDQPARYALLQIATDSSSSLQLDAVRTLGALPTSPETAHMLRTLLDSDNAAVRIEAYRILADTGEGIVTHRIGDNFLLDVVSGSGSPMVYATTSGVPRLAVFGPDQNLQTPITFTAMDMRLSITSSDGTDLLDLFYRDPHERDPIDVQSHNDLVEILARLGGQGRAHEPGFDFSFNDVVAIAQQLVASDHVYGSAANGQKTACVFTLEHPQFDLDRWNSIPGDNSGGRPQGTPEGALDDTAPAGHGPDSASATAGEPHPSPQPAAGGS